MTTGTRSKTDNLYINCVHAWKGDRKSPSTKAMRMNKTSEIKITQKSTWAGQSMQCFLKGIQGLMAAYPRGVGEFRSGDWNYVPQKETLMPGGNGTSNGEKMKLVDWGRANSGPWVVEGNICGAKREAILLARPSRRYPSITNIYRQLSPRS
ncbi:hypothetical protein EV426DRAFT_603019, partial [Tirmania nivea]